MTLPPLLQQPHHDSGPVHVPQPPRHLGDEVLLRLWVPEGYPLSAAAVRTVVDGEISSRVLGPVEQVPGGAWWEARLTLHNPVQPYRFVLSCDPQEAARADVPAYAWLTAAGLVPWDVSDARDFRLTIHEHPEWVADAVVYQIFPDRFARSTGAPVDPDGRPQVEDLPEWAEPRAWHEEPAVRGDITGRQLYGGDLDGIIEHLDHVASLGADTVYLTPIFPAGSVHRYDATTFDRVDPLLGGDEALVRLSRALHERGMRLILDLTTNHTGAGHEWFRTAQADPASVEAGFYLFTHHPDGYASWLDVPSLPKLDHRSAPLRARMYEGPGSVVARWLDAPVEADGWRIDVANMTGRHGAVDLAHEVARSVRRTLDETARRTGRPTWLVAEHGHDATGDLVGDGWHGTMNYAGITRPLWTWLAADGSDLNWLGLPMSVPRLPGQALAHTLSEYNAELSWPARLCSQNLLSSHDTPRLRTLAGDREVHHVGLTALAALPGAPTLFAGEELGAEGTTGEHSRTPMPWSALAAAERTGRDTPGVDTGTLAHTRTMLGLRRQLPALRRGGLRLIHVEEDAVTLLRTHPEGDVLVHLARAAHTAVTLELSALPGAPSARLLHAHGAVTADPVSGSVTLRAGGPGGAVLCLERPLP
ncbi:glycoside hydrolase family 13 protein [Brachybacterium sp. EF45031]|uniref:glycoside hydrolase family 13 protein n=1 Tax=Brachybacterium sillae TaxID=2810536 RepID=UPI00217CEA65|nr:glycoside hydrolase family 13 protein [Brachybacterium sillae]MCS6712543.1 glycoside hydrolase family 13 protein [Brachybacterium sillae]